MKILSLTAENVKRLNIVQINPDGTLVVIGGKNAQGKSSVLDCILMAIAGGKTIPQMPIKKGAKEGMIRLDLGEFVVTRKFSEKTGSSLTVTNADSSKVTSPQAMLDKLMPKIAFDPIKFSKMDKHEQFEELRKLVGLDFSGLDADRAKHYNDRTVKNREVDRQKLTVQQSAHYPNAPTKIPDSAELLAQLEKANAHNARIAGARANFETATRWVSERTAEVARLEEELAAARASLAQAVTTRDEQAAIADEEEANIDGITAQITSIGEIRSQVESNDRRAAAVRELRALESQSEELTKAIDKIDASKAKMIGEAKFPIEGLGFAEFEGKNIVTLNEIPFSEASEAEKLRVSVAMGIAMNPTLKVLTIRDGSLLDEDNLKLIAEMAEAAGAQVWIERVGKGAECSLIMEDGMIAEDRTEAAAK